MRPLAGTPATSTTEPCNPELNDGRGLVVRDKWRPRRLARRGRLLGRRRSGRLAQGHQRVLQSAKIGHGIRATQNSVRARWRRHGHDRCRRGAARQESDDHDWRGPALLIARVCRRGRPQTSFARQACLSGRPTPRRRFPSSEVREIRAEEGSRRFGCDARVPIEAGVLVADGVVTSASTASAATGHSHQVIETEQQLVCALLASIGDEGRKVVAQSVPATCGAELGSLGRVAPTPSGPSRRRRRLPPPDEHDAAAAVKIALLGVERFTDPKPRRAAAGQSAREAGDRRGGHRSRA